MPAPKTILAGDVGATKTYLGFFHAQGGRAVPRVERTFQNAPYPQLADLLEDFFRTQGRPELSSVCFGVAATPVEGRWAMTNLPWVIQAKTLRSILQTERIFLLNDLEALGYGIPTLAPERLLPLNTGRPAPEANAAVIAAGTGLGECILFWDGQKHRPMATEGGHADFAPRTALEIEFLRYALQRLGHVSYERVVSGPGLHLIYRFLVEAGYGKEPAWLAAKLEGSDPSAAIVEAALAEKAELATQSLDMFVRACGAEAGNLALKALARAGVYVGGGIAPRIVEKLRKGAFMQAFTEKGRLSPLVADIPVRVIMEPKASFYGAAAYAAQQEGLI